MFFRKVFRSKINKLDNIERFSGHLFIGNREPISQHSFWVAVYSDYVFGEIFRGDNIGMQYRYLLLKYALLHDYPEAVIGNDITHPLKYNENHGKDIRYLLDKIIEEEIDSSEDLFDNFFKNFLNEFDSVDEVIISRFKSICKIADWISFLRICNVQCKLNNFDLMQPKKIGLKKLKNEVISLKEKFGLLDNVNLNILDDILKGVEKELLSW